MESKFRGMGVALVTPFHKDGTVDYDGLHRLVEHNINNGTDYLVVQGTTGESVTLTKGEKRTVLDAIIKTNAGRLPVVLGVGGNNTAALVETLKTFDFKGVDAILSASPSYNKPTQAGIYQHYKTLSENSPLPIILYNVPGRTASNMTAETSLSLARDFSNIIAIKEASGDLGQVMNIIQNKPDGFLVVSGDDALTVSMIAVGMDGVISVVGNAFPKTFSETVHSALNGDFATARVSHYKLLEIIDNLFVEGNPCGVKEVLQFLEICENNVRLPLVPVSEKTSLKLKSLIAEAALVEVTA